MYECERIIKRKVRERLPRPVKLALEPIAYFLTDVFDLRSGRPDTLMPPASARAFVGGGNFREIGEEFLQYFIRLACLKPNENVLDVGCGIGRMAIPLTKYLNENGSYEGFDIVSRSVDWLRKNITPKYPNFHFQLADIFNKEYNPKGRYSASEYKFPYENESFDFVFLTSVFTHMLPQDMKNYFYEIARVLKKQGKCLITFFLLNDEARKLIDAKKSKLDFKYVFGGYRTTNKSVPEAAIAYDEQMVRVLFEKHGLRIKEPIHYGSYCGRQNFLSYQDIIIASKEG
jgi:ubiquinone/menaquinone biosynthesis C-methylase UbiE